MISRADIYFGGYDLAAYSKAFEVIPKAAIHVSTNIEATSVTRVGGNVTSSITGSGFWDATVSGALRDNLGTSAPMSFCIPNDTEANDAVLVNAVNASYSLGTAAGDVIPFSFAADGTGRPVAGKTLCVDTIASAATETSTPQEIGAVAAGYKVFGNLHAITFTGDDIVVKLQSSATEGGVYADRVTFDTLTAIGSDHQTDTTVDTDTWWQVEATATGATVSIEYIVTIGIALA